MSKDHGADTELPCRLNTFLPLELKFPQAPDNLILTDSTLQLYVDEALDLSPPRGDVT